MKWKKYIAVFEIPPEHVINERLLADVYAINSDGDTDVFSSKSVIKAPKPMSAEETISLAESVDSYRNGYNQALMDCGILKGGE